MKKCNAYNSKTYGSNNVDKSPWQIVQFSNGRILKYFKRCCQLNILRESIPFHWHIETQTGCAVLSLQNGKFNSQQELDQEQRDDTV